MANPAINTLESTISAYVNAEYKEIPPTEEEFLEKANGVRMSMQAMLPVTDQEFSGILQRLRQTLVIQMDVGVYISDRGNGHQSWLPSKRADFDFFFWNRYKKYLEEEKHWNPRVTTNLGKVSDEILDLCGDPSAENFAIKGLVLGDVQSGKTANYTAICNKAADTGYRIIVVLAGIQENLRKQTQERIDAECTGRKSEYYLDPKAAQGIKNQPVGVGRHGIQKKIVAFTSVTKDFDSGVLRNNNLGIENVNCPVVIVVKKNKRILNNLITWLSDNNTQNAQGQIELPFMLIDDEADNASVNTKDPESNPAAINDCIRRLLLLFSKTTYLGITATPFANIFIDPGNDDDLFPADFIYALSPPSNYIGADRIFGDGGDYENVLEEIDADDLKRYFPLKHKKTHIVSELPEDLYEAAYYFLLTNAVRDYRGDTTEHRSMMVHISLYTDVQAQIAEILNLWIEQVKSDVRNYSQLPASQNEKIKNISNLHTVWNKFNLTESVGIEWDDLLKNYLYRAIAPIDVRAVNMKTGAASLDYFNHKNDGLRVIAVGGNSLSRGLTLEGLCVSYFYRNTKMYDTLLQMGRWFGYRPNYGDLVKVWMSSDAITWYAQITRASAELKMEIGKMRNAHQTPREFGLKVRQDPGALIVTARNKMRAAEDLSFPVTMSGNLLETPRLKASQNILAENEKAFKKFIDLLAQNGERLYDEERTRGHYYWEHVPAEHVVQLLLNFETNPWHLGYNGRALAEFIEQNDWTTGWDVVLLNSGDGSPYPFGIRCGDQTLDIQNTEKRSIFADKKMLSINAKLRVGSGGCTRIGLMKKEIEDARARFFANPQNAGKKNVPDKVYLTKNRQPILMLHIIEADYSKSTNKDLPPFLFALGVGFPETEKSMETANYKVNMVEIRNWADIDTNDVDEVDD